MKASKAFIHPTSVVEPGAAVGAGTKVWLFCHVMAGARVGKDCQLGQNVYVDRNVRIGDGVKIQNNVSIYEGVTVEAGAFLGPSCVFTNVKNPRSPFPRERKAYLRTRVGRGASIGANATVVCGNDVGRHAFVGAGAVVTKDVPDHAVVTGAPARVAGWMCLCGGKISFTDKKGRCADCRRAYRMSGAGRVQAGGKS